ncbi:MAG: transport-related LysE family membrane protein [Candidatus Peregrinibacteria bacterium Greene0416_19]|nr:MAG: transport-related LysE family membrane protein [Candidatus Peregrinibacteria bacterium Greene0416_19]
MSTFLTVALIHFLAVASPGPDFAVVTRNSLTRSRRSGILTGIGCGLGILVHVAYCILGLGLIIARSIVLFNVIKLVGAAYLIFIGWKALTSKAVRHDDVLQRERADLSPLQAFRMGFLVNVLNPKATLFMLALFTQVINPATPIVMQALYGLYMGLATAAWFAGVSSVFSLRTIRDRCSSIQTALERVMGAVLIGLGLKVALATRE